LYEGIKAKVIRSDELPESRREVEMIFRGATVVLCTLSMLSNPKLAECGIIDILPVTSLVIDEASQIDVFEFMASPLLALWAISDTLNQHLFYKFSKVLTKVCFFGDPKQRES
jgi:regulator of nonsense transcripts 1